MKKLSGSMIRNMWLEFFKSKDHEIIPSASLIPYDDPTLLWINAGVAPLKKYFDGREKPNNPRMTNAQKSIRTNDIDNVGKTARHHTFFEMLGNFSIGDYFRNDVLPWAYELLFSEKWFAFSQDKIYITYYPEDLDTYNKWVEVGIQPDHLIALPGNFWEIGEGPCGPDTEIFYDRGVKYDPENIGIDLLKNDIDNDRYIEIWNIVFSQFNSKTGLKRSEYPELPSKNIDTGCGLERLACIIQGVDTNYDSDLFMPLIDYISDITGLNYHDAINKMPYRVIADHIRSVTFAISDGASLSNEGRGYVLRRILRRAVRYGRKLGITRPFLYELVDIVVDNFKDFYPYLESKKEVVKKVIKIEEENFLKTLESGEKRLIDIIKSGKDKLLSGKDAFLLYDTFGFPIELTMEVCEEKGYVVDVDGFNEELKQQKERARLARSNMQSMNAQNEEYLNFKDKVAFTGYNDLVATSNVIKIFKDGKSVLSATGVCEVVTKITPFYGEMGGQIGDSGTISINNNEYNVETCYHMPNGQNVHVVDLGDGMIKIDDVVTLTVNEEIRNKICANHSGTHLLNQALRNVLGNHVIQQGSLVTDNRLRFDFNHYQNLEISEICAIEKLVNEEIQKASSVNTIETTIEDAKKRGAQAVFGEKYGDVVRLVEMGFSKELCGGTHVKNTSEINKFIILSIESKGSGIFRIEATTSINAIDTLNNILKGYIDEINETNEKIMQIAKLAKEENIKINYQTIELQDITYSYMDIINYRNLASISKKELKQAEKQLEQGIRNKGSNDLDKYLANVKNHNDFKYLIEVVNNLNVDVVKDIIDKIAEKYDKCVICFANIVDNSKIVFVAKSKNTSISAGNLVKAAAIATSGNGGGRNDFAQAGGKDVSKINESIEVIKGIILG